MNAFFSFSFVINRRRRQAGSGNGILFQITAFVDVCLKHKGVISSEVTECVF